MPVKIATRIAEIPSSPTLTLNNKAKEMEAAGIHVINFGVGEPDFDTPEYIKDVAKLAIDQNFTRYTANAGIIELRRAICDKFKRDNNLLYQPDDILVSPGAKASIVFSLMALCDPGDRVLIPVPYWVSYPSQVMLASATPVFVTTAEENNFKLTASLIDEAVAKYGKIKTLILNSPNNPTGAVYTQDELSSIAEACLRNDIFVLSDEIYEKLVFDGTVFSSIANVSEESKQNTLIINGVSKAFAMTGWRLGYCAGPTHLVKAAGKIQEHASSNVNSITQKATVTALTKEDGSVEKMRAEFEVRKNYLVKALREIPHITCIDPKGAFYAVPNVSWYLANNTHGIKTSSDLSLYLLEHCHIAAVSGDSFGMESIIRFSVANSMANLVEGVQRFAKGLAEL